MIIGATLFVLTLLSKYDILGASDEGHFQERKRKYLVSFKVLGKTKVIKIGECAGRRIGKVQ